MKVVFQRIVCGENFLNMTLFWGYLFPVVVSYTEKCHFVTYVWWRIWCVVVHIDDSFEESVVDSC